MKILFINQHYGPDAPATGVLLWQLVESLATRGHTITVLADGCLPEGGRARETIRFIRVNALPIASKSTWRRLLHYGSYFGRALLLGLRSERPDTIVAMTTPPLLAPLLAWLLALAHRVPFSYNIQDLYPDVAIAAGRLPKILAPLALALARHVECRAASISTVGEAMARVVSQRTPRRIKVLRNWADAVEIRPGEPLNYFRRAWGLENDFVLQYAGNLGICHDAAFLADVIELLRDQPVHFLFVASGVGKTELQRRVGHNPKVHFQPLQPRSYLAQVLTVGNAHWVTLAKGMGRYLVPSKAYAVLAAARPALFVSDLGDDLHRLAKTSAGALWSAAGDVAAAARAILRLQQDCALRERLGKAGRRYVEEAWNRELAVREWENWLTFSCAQEDKRTESRAA